MYPAAGGAVDDRRGVEDAAPLRHELKVRSVSAAG